MKRIRYQLGVNLSRRRLIVWSNVRGRALVIAIVIVGLLGLGSKGIVTLPHIFGGSRGSQLDHRQHRYGVAGKYHELEQTHATDATQASWLQTKQADSTIPTATPSTTTASAQVAAAVELDAAPSSSNNTDESAATDQTATSSPDTQPVTSLPESSSVPVAAATVQTPAATVSNLTTPTLSLTVTTTIAALPTIVLPAPSTTVTDDGLDNPAKKDIAMQLVSSAENSSLDWKAQYSYIEDIGDGRGYTGGIIGFCSGTGDMLEVVQNYTKLEAGNPLASFIPALQKVNGTDSHTGLGVAFVAAWKKAATDPLFQQAQNDERDTVYFNPAVEQAKTDGLRTLGQFIYYDAIVMHGPGNDPDSFGGIRAAAMKQAKTPAEGGDEATYLNAFLNARVAAMKKEAAHDDTSRVDTEQRVFLDEGNFNLDGTLTWKTYGDSYTITQ
jgi:chitosanase